MSIVLQASLTQFLTAASNLGIGTNDSVQKTMAIWFKRNRTSAADFEKLMVRGYASSGTTTECIDISTGNLVRARTTYTTDDLSVSPALTDTAGWHLAIAEFPRRDGVDNSGVILTLDGTTYTADTSTRTNTGAFDVFHIGRISGTTANERFDGKVAHAAVWNCLLSASEKAQLLTKMPGAISYDVNSAANLRAYWALMNAAGGYVDSSGNGYTLTPTNGPSFDDADNPALDGSAGQQTSDEPFLIIPRRQLFVTRRIIQH